MHDTMSRSAASTPHADAAAPRPCAARRRDAIPAGATGVITIDLAQVRANWRALARHVAPAECAAVVKADAYGLGAARVIPALLDAGCRTFFVATLEEAHGARAWRPAPPSTSSTACCRAPRSDVASLCAIPVLSSLEEARAWASLGAGSAQRPARGAARRHRPQPPRHERRRGRASRGRRRTACASSSSPSS